MRRNFRTNMMNFKQERIFIGSPLGNSVLCRRHSRTWYFPRSPLPLKALVGTDQIGIYAALLPLAHAQVPTLSIPKVLRRVLHDATFLFLVGLSICYKKNMIMSSITRTRESSDLRCMRCPRVDRLRYFCV